MQGPIKKKDFAFKNPFHDHKPPVTRRDFLSRGVIAASAGVFLPSLLARNAWAADCGGGPDGGNWIPYLVFDMAGGAALPGNFLVGGPNGPEHLLPSYNQLGWNPLATNSYDRRFGLPMAVAGVSQLFNGIITTLSADAQALFRMGSICHRAQDDTSTNPLSALDLVMRAGYKGGSALQQALGSVNSTSGGNSRFGTEDLNLKPLFIDQVNTLMDAVSLRGLAGYPESAKRILGTGLQEAGRSQWPLFQGADNAEKVEQLGECLFGQLDLAGATAFTDPRRDPMLQRVYGLRDDTPALDEDAVAAAIVANVIKGNTGPGAITVGGCDYHDGNPIRGNAKDLAMGRHIGRAVQVAHELGRPLFIQLITDGGCSVDEGTRNWRSDAGDKCMSVIGYYNPNGAPQQIRKQVGYYTAGQGVSLTTLVGDSPLRGAHAAFANYLQVHGKLSEYSAITQRTAQFSPGELPSVLVFDQGIA